MKKLIKPAVLFTILIGTAAGILLYILGDAGDAPGLSLVGMTAAFLLIIWGIYKADIIKKDLLIPIILICFGTGGALFSIALLFDGEFEKYPVMAFIGVALGALFITIGIIILKNRDRSVK